MSYSLGTALECVDSAASSHLTATMKLSRALVLATLVCCLFWAPALSSDEITEGLPEPDELEREEAKLTAAIQQVAEMIKDLVERFALFGELSSKFCRGIDEALEHMGERREIKEEMRQLAAVLEGERVGDAREIEIKHKLQELAEEYKASVDNSATVLLKAIGYTTEEALQQIKQTQLVSTLIALFQTLGVQQFQKYL